MKYDFNKVINRRNTNSFKWDANEEFYGNKDVLPLWVADMDFECAKPIIDSLKKRVNHGIFGYTIRPQSYYDAIIDWMEKRHNWKLNKEWLAFCSPGIIQAINILINKLTNPGDKIIIQLPNYDPLFDVIKNNNRILINSPLKLENNKYIMDFEGLISKIDSEVKMLILCSPHNPTGRVWTKEELLKLGQICIDNNIIVISDEIHADIVYKNNKHISFGSISEEFSQNSITCISANKTFNLGGLQLSTIIIPNPKIRKIYNQAVLTSQIRLDNIFGAVALEAGYRYGEEWLDQVIDYIEGNLNFLKKYLENNIPQIKVIEPEGTYFAWLDFRGLNLKPKELREFLINKANVALCDGYEFGKEGEGFERLNMACPRSTLEMALKRIGKAISEL